MADDERIYNVPLRRKFLNTPKYRRAKKAVNALREFISRHLKVEIVKIDNTVNQQIWKNGIKNPPHHIKVIAKKTDDTTAVVEPVNPPKKREKKKVKEALIKKEESIEEKVENKESEGNKESEKQQK